MAAAAATGPSSSTSALGNINDSKKRWMVFGLALKDLVDQIRSSVEKEVKKDYDNLKTSHGIDSQSSIGRLERWSSTFLKYENINGNDAVPKLPRGKFNYAAFDCRVMSHVDYAKLYLESYMAKFTVFDEHCDASAVLNLLGRVLVFSPAVQSAAHDVRQDRNAWAHCAFQDWDPAKFQQCFQDMEKLVKALGLPAVGETKLLTDLNIWGTTGPSLCMNASLDPALLQMVQQHVNKLIADVDKMMFEVDCDRETVTNALQGVAADVKELEKRISAVETKQIGTDERIGTLEQRVTQVEEQLQSSVPQISFERHDPDTREWLFGDIDTWFYAPGDSRAYVLLGDAGVGKSVIAGALAKRAKDAGYLGAAHFCHYKDETRNDPKILLADGNQQTPENQNEEVDRDNGEERPTADGNQQTPENKNEEVDRDNGEELPADDASPITCSRLFLQCVQQLPGLKMSFNLKLAALLFCICPFPVYVLLGFYLNSKQQYIHQRLTKGLALNVKIVTHFVAFLIVVITNVSLCYASFQRSYMEVKRYILKYWQQKSGTTDSGKQNTIPEELFWSVSNQVLPVKNEICRMFGRVAFIVIFLFWAISSIIFSGNEYDILTLVISGAIPSLFFRGLIGGKNLVGWRKIKLEREIKQAVKNYKAKRSRGGINSEHNQGRIQDFF